MSYRDGKAALDFIMACLLVGLLGPALLLIGALVALSDRGAVLFRQTRVGTDGRYFVLCKFRTMRIGAPNLSTAEMQALGKSYVTPVGYWLRKSSLDELPQLLNILRGEMSFVGPRPALPSQTEVNALRERYGVHVLRPGITGLAQVMGRDELQPETKVGYDAEYLRTMSLLTDIRIVLRTFLTIVTAEGNR